MPIGVDNLKIIVHAGIRFGTQAAESFRDGFQWTDIFQFIGVFSEFPTAIQAAKVALQELKELDEANRVELYSYIQTEFDIPDDKVEYEVEAAIGALLYGAALVSSIRERKVVEQPPTDGATDGPEA